MTNKLSKPIATRWAKDNEITSLITDVDKLREFATNDISDLLDEIAEIEGDAEHRQHAAESNSDAAEMMNNELQEHRTLLKNIRRSLSFADEGWEVLISEIDEVLG